MARLQNAILNDTILENPNKYDVSPGSCVFLASEKIWSRGFGYNGRVEGATMDYSPRSAWDHKLAMLERGRAAVPDSYPTAYPETSPTAAVPDSYPTAYPETRPEPTVAERIDPGMMPRPRSRGVAADHRGREVHAGKRTTQVSRDPYVNYLATRKPTVPSIISRQGIKDTVDRYGLEMATGALGYMAATNFAGNTTGGFDNLVEPDRIPGGLMGAAAGAALGYGITRMDRKRRGS